MQGVQICGDTLMDVPSGGVEKIPGLQHNIQYGFSDLVLIKVAAGVVGCVRACACVDAWIWVYTCVRKRIAIVLVFGAMRVEGCVCIVIGMFRAVDVLLLDARLTWITYINVPANTTAPH